MIDDTPSALQNCLEQFSATRKTTTVFQDFLKLSALSISNGIDKAPFDSREESYLRTIAKYSKEEQALFPKMLASLVVEMETFLQKGEIKDVLGSLYEKLNMGSKTFQQYFTPEHVAKLMATIMNPAPNDSKIETISDPTCGSGRLILAYAETLHKKGENFQEKMKVSASDIDIDCVHMAYIQCSLYHIPAVIRHENSLSKEIFATYKTPAFVLKYEKQSFLENLFKTKETLAKQEKSQSAKPKNKEKPTER